MWRTLPNLWSPQTGHLLTRTPSDMVNPLCFPCSALYALHWEWSSWTKLPLTTSRHQKWWRMIGNWGYTQSPTMRLRIPILCLMERMADHWCNVGTFHMFWKWWWRNTPRISTPTTPMYKQTHHHAQQGNPNNYLHIPRRRSGRPSYSGPNHSICLSNSTTTSHIIPMHCPQSIYNVQRCSSIRRNFHCSPILAITYLTSLHPIWIDIPPAENFSSKFTHHPSWATNSMYHLIHWLGQQNAIWLHGTKKVLIPSWL